MKLVFPGGEHPQVLLGPGLNRVGSGVDANVHIDRPGVLAEHCELHVTASGVVLHVPGGAAVAVNGRAVEGVIALRPGDTVTFEGINARLASIGMPSIGTLAGDGGLLDAQAANDASLASVGGDPQMTVVRPVIPRYVLRGVSGAAFGRVYPVVGATTIGRAAECTLRIDDANLSRLHARLVPNDAGLWIEDAGSTNGCFVNGRRVQAAQAEPGDEIGFDALRFQLIAPGQRDPAVFVLPSRVKARAARWPLWTAAGVVALTAIAAAVVFGFAG